MSVHVGVTLNNAPVRLVGVLVVVGPTVLG